MWPYVNFKADIDAFIQSLRSEYIYMAYADLEDQLVEVCNLLGVNSIEIQGEVMSRAVAF